MIENERAVHARGPSALETLMRFRWLTVLGALATFVMATVLQADEAKERLVPEDVYQLAGPQLVVAAPHPAAAAVIYRRIDQHSRQEVWSLRWADATGVRLLESEEFDARAVSFSPDGKWLAVRSTRPHPAGGQQIPATPPQSDVATDIWLISSDGKQAVPLAGPDKPYGRVFQDPFYGRVCFSADGKQLAFIADGGVDPRTKEEIEGNVFVVRRDQGEGYTGYGAAQVWIAELKETLDSCAARSIRRLTDDWWR